MTSRLILVRHGETEGNVAKILDTRLPGAPLTSRGEEQARAFGTGLAGRRIAALVASQALRARQTAELIASATDLTVAVRDGIHEAQAGDYEGRSDEKAHAEFRAVFQAWHAGDYAARMPGGESGEEILDRYVPVVTDLRDRLDEGDVVLVSHGAAIRLVGRYLGSVPGRFASRNHLDNTATVELEPAGDAWTCVRWGPHEPPFEDVAAGQVDDPMG